MTASTHELAIGEDAVVKTFRSWDRAEPDREWAALEILHRRAPGARVRGMRRLFAVFWLHMLRPGNRGHRRNPAGSVDRQAERTLTLLC